MKLSRLFTLVFTLIVSSAIGQVRERQFDIKYSPIITISSTGSMEYVVLDNDTADLSDDTLMVITNNAQGAILSSYSYPINSYDVKGDDYVFDLRTPDGSSLVIIFSNGNSRKVTHKHKNGYSEYSGNITY